MLIVKVKEFLEFCPHIKTEETICNLLERDKDQISDDYALITLPLAHMINTIGVDNTNNIISQINIDKRRVFVCQHIFVDKLKFLPTDMVFTPHSIIGDNFHTIPHYSVNVDRDMVTSNENLFSFLGSITTHTSRKKLVELYDTCYDSKVHWGLDKDMGFDFRRKYIELLGNSKYSLCPRGTGISSVRLFESMGMSSMPVVIGDGYKFPLPDLIEWDKCAVHVKENELEKIPEILENNLCDISMMIENYNTYFSNENLHETIKITLNK